jgi:hypothetical protein
MPTDAIVVLDAAATILRWLIGDDDHVPVRTESPGELVGGFGDIVRSPAQIADILSMAVQGAAHRAAVQDRDLRTRPVGQEIAWQDASYLEGVAATLAWVLGERPGVPISHNEASRLAARDLKRERMRADDRDRTPGRSRSRSSRGPGQRHEARNGRSRPDAVTAAWGA